jgi:hypothetical protein
VAFAGRCRVRYGVVCAGVAGADRSAIGSVYRAVRDRGRKGVRSDP